MSNFQLLSNPYFLLIGLSNVLGMLGFYTPFVYLPSMASAGAGAGGVDVSDANFLISVIGISNTVFRVVAGWLSDLDGVTALGLTNAAILVSGLSVVALPWCGALGGYPAYVALALVFGGGVAAYISLTSIVLVDLLGLDNLTSAFGMLVLFR